MKRHFIILNVLFFVLSAPIISCGSGEKKKEKSSSEINTTVYECPMKCNNGQTYDKPGTCPVCGTELEKVTKT